MNARSCFCPGLRSAKSGLPFRAESLRELGGERELVRRGRGAKVHARARRLSCRRNFADWHRTPANSAASKSRSARRRHGRRGSRRKTASSSPSPVVACCGSNMTPRPRRARRPASVARSSSVSFNASGIDVVTPQRLDRLVQIRRSHRIDQRFRRRHRGRGRVRRYRRCRRRGLRAEIARGPRLSAAKKKKNAKRDINGLRR